MPENATHQYPFEKEYRRMNRRIMCLFGVYLLLLIYLVYVSTIHPILRSILFLVMTRYIYRLTRHLYVKTIALSLADENFTEKAENDPKLKEVLKKSAVTREIISEVRKRSPKYQMLRASTEPQDDTLLRAAAYTDNAPQEQLLRPANDTESHH